ncbi:MAG TPA: SCP2 sterol-binding domain-containing protein [Bacteroidetes bacterium]|nr:SCP2 sterol-binding domain-containing protein [Bacteroidota bacterium]
MTDSAKDFICSLPQQVKKEWLKGIDTNFHFDISGKTGGQFSVIAADEKLEVHEYFTGKPKCIISSKDVHFIKLLKGELNPVMALLTGKLKVSDQEEVIKHAKIFGLM